MAEKITKTKINWKKLLIGAVVNGALASVGAATFPDAIGIAITDPKGSAKLAGIGAILGALNLVIPVTKQVLNEKFFKTDWEKSENESDSKPEVRNEPGERI